jgi:hypothetical protein
MTGEEMIRPEERKHDILRFYSRKISTASSNQFY